MSNLIHINKDYAAWIGELKIRIRQSQIKAAVKVNTELLQLYWQLGSDIVEKQKNAKWGDGFLKQLSQDLSAEFPEMKGFSLPHIKTYFHLRHNLCRKWKIHQKRHNLCRNLSSLFLGDITSLLCSDARI